MQGRQENERMKLRQGPSEWMRKTNVLKPAPGAPQGWPGTLKGKGGHHRQLPVTNLWGLESLLGTFLSEDLSTSQMGQPICVGMRS